MMLDEMQRSLPGESIFCGDFNARGQLWRNTIINSQGEALEDALDQWEYDQYGNEARGLGQRNRPSHHHHQYAGSSWK